MSASTLLSSADPNSLLRWLRSLGQIATLGLALLIFSEDADAGIRRAFGLSDAPLGFSDFLPDGDFLLPHAAQSTSQSGSLSDLFKRPGLVGGFAAGFLGSGLVGLAFGRGLLGGLSGPASVLGLAFQLGLIAMLARLVWAWRRRAVPFADLSPRQLADAYRRDRYELPPQPSTASDRRRDERYADQPPLTSGDHRAT